MMSGRATVLLVNEDPYTIRACLQAGLRCVLVHGPGLIESGYIQIPPEVETVLAEDVASVESVLSALTRAGLRDRAFACVQTSDEEALVTAAALGVVLGVPAMSPDVAVLFRDKWLQKQVVSEAGVPVARSRVINDIHHVDPAIFDGFSKAVLKPIASGGTQRTSIIRSREELAAAGAALRREGVSARTFVLEEFVDGVEWVVNGVVVDGACRFQALGVYSETCLTTVSTGSAVQVETLDPVDSADSYELVRPVVDAVLAALGLHSAVFHMELFVPDDGREPVFGECAARRGGGMTHEVVQQKFGVDLGAAAVACALGVEPDLDVSLDPDTVGSTSLVRRPGLLVRCPTADDLEGRPGVRCARIDLPWGSVIGDKTAGTFQRVGQVLVTARTPEDFRAQRDDVVRWFDERLVLAPVGASPADLRAWQVGHWPGTADRFAPFRAVGVEMRA